MSEPIPLDSGREGPSVRPRAVECGVGVWSAVEVGGIALRHPRAVAPDALRSHLIRDAAGLIQELTAQVAA